MSQNKLIGIIALVLGIALLAMGYNATQSPLEEVGEALTGRFSDETTWYLIGGAIASILGIVFLVRK